MSDYKFDVEKVTEDCVAWIKEWFRVNGGEKPTAIVGISGGKDSAVVAMLCAKALGKDNVVGVMMPNGEQKDLMDAYQVMNCIRTKRRVIANIGEIYKAFEDCAEEFWTTIDPERPKPNYSEPLKLMLGADDVLLQDTSNPEAVKDAVKAVLDMDSEALRSSYIDVRTGLPPKHITDKVYLESVKWNEQAKINAPARFRMAVLYALAAQYGGRVANTCNRSEDVCGYATLYGDSAGDFSPLSKLTVTEVIAIGEYLGLPQEITRKTPSDGLCGKSDEESLGMKYAEIDEWLREGKHADTIGKVVKERWLKSGKFKLDLINLPSYSPCLYDYMDYVSDEVNRQLMAHAVVFMEKLLRKGINDEIRHIELRVMGQGEECTFAVPTKYEATNKSIIEVLIATCEEYKKSIKQLEEIIAKKGV